MVADHAALGFSPDFVWGWWGGAVLILVSLPSEVEKIVISGAGK